jgi:hypothetical protein
VGDRIRDLRSMTWLATSNGDRGETRGLNQQTRGEA